LINRFEVEENILVEEELVLNRLERYDPVLYCYELQLDPSVHRHGLGRRLMQMLELTVRGQFYRR
jgi:GNAT superfamily N-acetyltransferase